MKKRFLALLLTGVMAFGMVGCGNKKNDKNDATTATEEATTSPTYEMNGTNHKELNDYSEYVSIKEYKGFTVKVSPTDVTEKQLKNTIDQILKSNVTYEHITDRVVGEKDKVNMDFEGKIDGEAIKNGSATNYDYSINGGFTDSLDDQLVGLEVGKEVELNCTFPNDGSVSDEVAGKDAVFTVKINYIYGEEILPEWNDEFVKEVTGGEYTSVEAVEKYLNEALLEQNKNTQLSTYTNGIWTEILDRNNCTISSYPEEKVEELGNMYYDYYKNQFTQMATSYKTDYSVILMTQGFTNDEALKTKCAELAKEDLPTLMVACIIANKEGIAVTDAIYNAKLEEILKTSGYKDISELEKVYSEDYIMESLILDAVSVWLRDNCTMEVTEEEETTTAQTTTAASEETTTSAE